MTSQPKPCIWFTGQAEEAMKFYTEIYPNSKIKHIERYEGGQGIPGEDELKGKVLTGIFEINGLEFQCLDGPENVFKLEGAAVSFAVEYDTQDELDEVWEKLLEGGQAQQCGWIVDKFGVTWQIVPSLLGKLLSDPQATPAQKNAVFKAFMPMVKLEIAPLQEAFDKAK
jgi:predicted 3-demethylubiquinone-9 3-methyltransferase (glyoxalase superfamily)